MLHALPGVRLSILAVSPRSRGQVDGRLRLDTETGQRDLLVQAYRSHLSHRTADHIVAVAGRSRDPIVILAPHIGKGIAEKFIKAGVNYVDANGNCHIAAPPVYVHVEGKSGSRSAAEKGLRRASYQVLFAYLAEQTLLDSPIRSVAEAAGVSRQPVADMRRRLLDDEYILATATKTRWHPRRWQDALSLWLHGYETTVRPSLIEGTYRTRDRIPTNLERRVAHVFGERGRPDFRWGGTAAGFRLTGHYRGERTVVHVSAPPTDLEEPLEAMADPRGNLIVMGAFGTINWPSDRETVHPLLVYAEMLHDTNERAREAAQELYDRLIAPRWA